MTFDHCLTVLCVCKYLTVDDKTYESNRDILDKYMCVYHNGAITDVKIIM